MSLYRCPNEARIEGHYIVFCHNGREVREKLYSINKGSFLINPLYSSLWELPWNLNSYAYIYETPGNPDDASFVLPQLSRSKFKGTSNKEYNLINWQLVPQVDSDLIGPVQVNGKQLFTEFSGINLRVRWESKEKINIGFYCNIANIGQDIYPLIDICNHFQLTCGTRGSFIIENYEDIYVACSSTHPTDVTLTFDVIIPTNLQPFPIDKYYLYFTYKCTEYKLLVANLNVINNCVVKPQLNPDLKQLYDLIRNTYKELSLSRTLSLNIIQPLILGQPYLDVDTYYKRIPIDPTPISNGYIEIHPFTRTDNIGVKSRLGRIYDLLSSHPYLGINIQPYQGSVTTTYKITITPPPQIRKLVLLCVVAYYFTNPNIWQLVPYEIRTNDTVVGNNHAWPNQGSFIVEGELTIPASYSNFVLMVRAGSKSAEQPFRYDGLSADNLDGFIIFNSIDINGF